MLGDDPNVEAQRRQIRAQAEDDIAEFIAQLDSDVGSGVPPPPQIKVTEVSSQPVEFDLVPFGGQDAGTTPAEVAPPGGGGELLWACCQSDEDCSETTAEDCADLGGEWFPGQTCADDPCDGACCDEFGFCLQLSEFDCTGTFQGIGVPCDPNPCAGRCCLPDGSCSDLSESDCADAGGDWTEGSNCADDPCPTGAMGACCNGTDCSITSEADCFGDYQGDDSTCDPNPCFPWGACCFFGSECYPDAGCLYLEGLTDQSWCESHGGTYQGNGTNCDYVDGCIPTCAIQVPILGCYSCTSPGGHSCVPASNVYDCCLWGVPYPSGGSAAVCHDHDGCLHWVNCGDTVYCGIDNPCTYESGAVCFYGIPCCDPDC